MAINYTSHRRCLLAAYLIINWNRAEEIVFLNSPLSRSIEAQIAPAKLLRAITRVYINCKYFSSLLSCNDYYYFFFILFKNIKFLNKKFYFREIFISILYVYLSFSFKTTCREIRNLNTDSFSIDVLRVSCIHILASLLSNPLNSIYLATRDKRERSIRYRSRCA